MPKFRNVYYMLLLALLSCRKPYDPPAISTPNSYLVVEGVINSGNDSTVIKISRTVKLDSSITINPVLGAMVGVESSQGNTFPLTDTRANGKYSLAPLSLSPSQKYRLRITIGRDVYLSDFTNIKPTPPIDSVGYTKKSDGIALYVNTHDPANKTNYYRWEYDENWEFHSRFQSFEMVDSVNNVLVQRTPDKQVYYCYSGDESPNIILTSTKQLSQDVVYQSPLTNIRYDSEKIELRYSILVKQYALTEDAYKFYQNIKKNIEQLGSIFDALPTQLIGNIHSVNNATEPVIGYITVTNVQSKRIFITNAVLPPLQMPADSFGCVEEVAKLKDVQNILINRPLTDLAIAKAYDKGAFIGYYYSTPICIDCRLRGTTTPPPYWK
jgi:hypothetical protein